MDNFDNLFGTLFLKKDELHETSTTTEISVTDSNDLASLSMTKSLNLENEITNATEKLMANTDEKNYDSFFNCLALDDICQQSNAKKNPGISRVEKFESRVKNSGVVIMEMVEKTDEKTPELGLEDLLNGLDLDANCQSQSNTENILGSNAEKKLESRWEDSESRVKNPESIVVVAEMVEKTDENIPNQGLEDLLNGLVLDTDIILGSNAKKKIELSRVEDSESVDDASEISSDEEKEEDTLEMDNNKNLEVPDMNLFHLLEIQNENYNNFINVDVVDPLAVIVDNNNDNIEEIILNNAFLDLRDLIINDYDWDELDMILTDEDDNYDEDYNNNSL